MPETLLHVVSGRSSYLVHGRYTWRHDSVLHFLALAFQSVRDSIIHHDLPGFINPSAITGDNLRPDLLLVLLNNFLYILELTVGFESNNRKNSHRKQKRATMRLLFHTINTIPWQDRICSVKISLIVALSSIGIVSAAKQNFIYCF